MGRQSSGSGRKVRMKSRGLVIGNLQTLPQASSYAGRLESEAAVS